MKFSKHVLNLEADESVTVWYWSYASRTGKYLQYVHTMHALLQTSLWIVSFDVFHMTDIFAISSVANYFKQKVAK